MKIGYARVSTKDQKLEMQLEALHRWLKDAAKKHLEKSLIKRAEND